MPRLIRRYLGVHRVIGLPLVFAAAFLTAFLAPAVAGAAAPDVAAGELPQLAGGGSLDTATPKDATSGFIIVGPVSNVSWGSGVATIAAAAVANNSATTSEALSLDLWAIPVSEGVPVISPSLHFSTMASTALGTLGAGKQITNIDKAGLAYKVPAAGCYYVAEALLNGTTLVDLFPLSFGRAGADGTPSPSGYAIFSFGGAACAQTTPCENSSTTACLLSGRFQVTATYYNASSGKAQGQVLFFGSTRAESDESVFFYFTDPGNFELGVKALDACTINDSFWIFLGGLTNQGWEVNVLDTNTGKFKTYTNALNVTTVTTTDTTALPCP
jgi:hypothetical protein